MVRVRNNHRKIRGREHPQVVWAIAQRYDLHILPGRLKLYPPHDLLKSTRLIRFTHKVNEATSADGLKSFASQDGRKVSQRSGLSSQIIGSVPCLSRASAALSGLGRPVATAWASQSAKPENA